MGINLYKPGTVIGYVGPFGSGKTLHMTVRAYIAYKKYGMPVYRNYDAYFGTELQSIYDLFTIRNAHVPFDEIQGLVDSREFSKNANVTQMFLLMRKRKLSLSYTSQHPSFIDLRVRRVTNYILWHYETFHNGRPASLVEYYKVIGGETLYLLGKGVMVFKDWMFKLYNTDDERVLLTENGRALPYSIPGSANTATAKPPLVAQGVTGGAAVATAARPAGPLRSYSRS
jgi:hypothetical protein